MSPEYKGIFSLSDAVHKNPLIQEDVVLIEREIARYLRGKGDRGGKRKTRGVLENQENHEHY